ncbi:MAG: hypothetical protein JXR68_01875 [Bacteroidales bacterium]|nr:hypothetical protein [Bacteroidales bacterium]
MKQLIIITAILLSGFAIFAQKSVGDYVTTVNGRHFYQNVNHGVFHFLNAKINGTKTSYTKEEVLEYKINNNVYTKLPVFINNQNTGKFAFMKALSYRSGLVLYEYEHCIDGFSYTDYFVYRNSDLVVTLTPENYLNLIDFFTGEVFHNIANAN